MTAMGEVIINLRLKNSGGSWWVQRQPELITDPMAVHFVRRARTRCCLDQVAQWTPSGWNPKRWVPRPPVVPKAILDQVEAHMRRLQP